MIIPQIENNTIPAYPFAEMKSVEFQSALADMKAGGWTDEMAYLGKMSRTDLLQRAYAARFDIDVEKTAEIIQHIFIVTAPTFLTLFNESEFDAFIREQCDLLLELVGIIYYESADEDKFYVFWDINYSESLNARIRRAFEIDEFQTHAHTL